LEGFLDYILIPIDRQHSSFFIFPSFREAIGSGFHLRTWCIARRKDASPLLCSRRLDETRLKTLAALPVSVFWKRAWIEARVG
jgi:hypothetical protein